MGRNRKTGQPFWHWNAFSGSVIPHPISPKRKTMNETTATSALVKRDKGEVEYKPFGADDTIKMSVAIVQNLVAVPTRSGKTCSEKDALKFIAMCRAKRLNPFEGDAYLIGYDGKEGPQFSLITAHQTYLKRAELHPEFDGMKSGIIIEENGELRDMEGDFFMTGQKVVGGWATVFFKNRKQPMHKRVRLARFQKSYGVWQDDPAGMICKCAEADALRSAFPTMLGGLYLREEIEPRGDNATVKPDFGGKPKLFGTPAMESAAPVSSIVSEYLPPEGAANERNEPSEQPGSVTVLESVRSLCAAAGVKEAKLLAFLEGIGLTDGSDASLDMVADAHPEVLERVYADWPDIARRIKETK